MNASTSLPLKGAAVKSPGLNYARLLRSALPGVSLVVLLITIFIMQPRAMSYMGMNLMLNLAVPIALATVAQMLIITVNDLDLSLGSFISFVACVAATLLDQHPVLGCLALLGCIAVYALLGALIHIRHLPSIVVTLGMSFVWMGAAVLYAHFARLADGCPGRDSDSRPRLAYVRQPS